MELNFIKGQFTEEQLENAIIELFKGMKGYTYVHGEIIHRKFEDICLRMTCGLFSRTDMRI